MKTNVWYLIGMVAAATAALLLHPRSTTLAGVAAGISFALLVLAGLDARRRARVDAGRDR